MFSIEFARSNAMADFMCLFPLGRRYWSNKISIGVHVKRWCRRTVVSHKWRMNLADGNVPSRYKQMLRKMPIHRSSVWSSTKWITLKWRRCDRSVCELNDVSQKQRHACVACVRVRMRDFIGCTVRTPSELIHACNVKRQRMERRRRKKCSSPD